MGLSTGTGAMIGPVFCGGWPLATGFGVPEGFAGGVSVGSLSVVGARSSTYKDLPDRQVCVGNPAKPIKERVLR